MSDTNAETNVAAEELRAFIERIEHEEAAKADIADGIKEIYSEAGGRGYDKRVLRKIVARRKADQNELAEVEAIEELYRQALGMM